MPLSLYLHIPFCTVRCGYCDFNTYAGLESIVPHYVEALCREIRIAGASLGVRDRAEVHTVYFGGGTPSLLPTADVAKILHVIRGSFTVSNDAEISLEANPGTVDSGKLEVWRSAGVNRLSMGAQSGRTTELALLDRKHSPEDVEAAVDLARRAGFANVNLDLMYGLPHQTLEDWGGTVGWALGLGSEHLSLYALSLESGTPLRHRVEAGLIPSPDPDLAADMYEAASLSLEGAGYVQYEISNWARPGSGEAEAPEFACRHNLQVWRNEPYLGLGAGAHGFALGWRYANVRSPRVYTERLRQERPTDPPCTPAVAERRRIEPSEEMDDTMMLGFRLTAEGVGVGRFEERFAEDPRRLYGGRLRSLVSAGLIEREGDVLRLTRRGRILGNQVFQAFV